MPVVPLRQSEYTGVPSVQPSGERTPEISVNAPLSAFGGAKAAGYEALAKGLGDVGNELFARAQALQQLNNEAEVNQAEANHIMEQSNLGAAYGELRGQAAKDGFQKFQEDSEALRQKYRSSLGSPMAQKMFDARSLSTMAYSVRHATYHAASEFTKYQLGASQSKIQAIGDQALSTPVDDNQFSQSLESTANEVRHQSNILGRDADQTEQDVAVAQSSLWSKRITGVAKTQPFTAKKMLQDATASGGLRGEDIAKVTNYVNQSLYTVGSRNISHQISTGDDGHFGAGKVSLPQAREAIGQIESGGNYSTVGVQTKHGRALGKYQVMEEFLPEFLRKAGMPSMTPQEFLKNPKAQDQLFDATFGGYMEKHGNFNDAASMWLTGKPLAEAGGRKDAHGTTAPEYLRRANAVLARNVSLDAQVARGTQLAQGISPDDPLFQDYVRQRIEADHNQIRRIKLDDAYTNRQTVEGGLMGGESGKLPTTLEELKAQSPQIEDAWSKLEPSKQRSYLSVLARNAKDEVPWSGEGLRDYQRLKGMASEDPAKFLDEDVISAKLPNSARRELVNLQAKIKSGAAGDPRMTKYMTAVAGDLNSAGISKTGDPDRYYQFRGAFEDAIHTWQEEKKKPPTSEEARQISARLLQEQSTPWWLNPWSKTPTFAMTVPAAEASAIKADPTWTRLGITPTEAQIQRIYTRSLYQRLFSKPSTTEEASAGPSAPVSR